MAKEYFKVYREPKETLIAWSRILNHMLYKLDTTSNVSLGGLIVKDFNIDFGTSLYEVNASDIPIIDTGGYYATDYVNEVLQELGEITSSSTDVNTYSQERTGFPVNTSTGEINLTEATISFDNGTRTFTIEPSGSEFTYYIDNEKHTKTTAQTVTITDVEGLHYIYFDGDTLTETTTFNIALIYGKGYVANIYWDATNSQAIHIGEERHGIKMDGHTHGRLHFKDGTIFVSGCALDSLSVDQDGSLNAHAQFGATVGEIKDEDLLLSLSAITSTTGLPILYKSGASENWRRTINTGFPVTTTGTGRLAYNENTGAVWQLTEVSNNKFALYHIYATNDIDYPYFSIMGENEYNNLSDARNGALNEINDILLSGLPFVEFVPIGTVIYNTNNTYTNSVKSIVVSTDTGDDYVDWRYSGLSSSTLSVVNHLNLTNLTGGQYTDGGHSTLTQKHATDSTAPTVNDDTDNYKELTIWLKRDDDSVYMCTDNTNSLAVWGKVAFANVSNTFTQDQTFSGSITSGDINCGAITTSDNVSFGNVTCGTITTSSDVSFGNITCGTITTPSNVSFGDVSCGTITTTSNVSFGDVSCDAITTTSAVSFGNVSCGDINCGSITTTDGNIAFTNASNTFVPNQTFSGSITCGNLSCGSISTTDGSIAFTNVSNTFIPNQVFSGNIMCGDINCGAITTTSAVSFGDISCGSISTTDGSIAFTDVSNTFVPNQTFSGSITCGNLSCGSITTTDGSIAFTDASNTFVPNQTFSGNITCGDISCGAITTTSAVSFGDVSCGSISTTDGSIAFTNVSNTFIPNQVFSGNIMCGDVSCGNITTTTGDIAYQDLQNIFTQDQTFSGNVFVQGDKIAVDKRISTSDNIIVINEGEVGTGVTSLVAGIEIDRGSSNPYRFIFHETNDDFRIGEYYTDLAYSSLVGTFSFNEEVTGSISGATGTIVSDSGTVLRIKNVSGTFTISDSLTGGTSGATADIDTVTTTDDTQSVATRENSPTDGAIPVWNDADNMFDTSIGLTAGEVDQLQKIDSVTISNAQWGYLGLLDQGLTTSSNVTFGNINCQQITTTDDVSFGNVSCGSITTTSNVSFGDVSCGTITSTSGDLVFTDVSNTFTQNQTFSANISCFDISCGSITTTDGDIAFTDVSNTFVPNQTFSGSITSGDINCGDISCGEINTTSNATFGDITCGSITTSTGGIVFTDISNTFTQDQTFTENVFIEGDKLSVDNRISTGDNIITINEGESGTGVTSSVAGIEVDRGSSNPYRFMFSETNDDFRVGEYYTNLAYSSLVGTFSFNEEVTGSISGATGTIVSDSGSSLRIKNVSGTFTTSDSITGGTSGATADVDTVTTTNNTKAVATREDSPINGAIAVWNNSSKIFDTSIGLTAGEVDQLQNIDSVTISNAQWGYLGALDQGLTTTSDVTFNDIDCGEITPDFIDFAWGGGFTTTSPGISFHNGTTYCKIGFDNMGTTGLAGYIRYNIDTVNGYHGHMFSAGTPGSTTDLFSIRADRTLFLPQTPTVPLVHVPNAGILFVQNGALKYLGGNGTTSLVAPA